MTIRPVALVTGGGTGIGMACAQALADAGCDVAIAGRRKDVLEDAVTVLSDSSAAGSVVPFVCDLADREAPEALVEEVARVLGAPSVLVNNAASCQPCDTLSLTSEIWDATHDVALRGAAMCSVAAARLMVDRGGRIIMITSIDELQSEPNVAHYCAAKAGLGAFARALAVDLAVHGIVVNSIAPGWVETPTASERLQGATAQSLRHLNALGRAAQPDEIASVVTYLALQAPPYLTGATIVVDGGQTVKAAMP